MIAQDGAEFLASCLHITILSMNLYKTLVSLHIGGHCAGSHMCLVAQDGIAHIVEMGHLRLVKDDGVLDFTGIADDNVLSKDNASS